MSYTHEKTVAVSGGLQKKWIAFRAALDAVAEQHTNGGALALPAWYAQDLPGGEAELDRALKSTPVTVRTDEVSGAFEQDVDRKLSMLLRW